MKQIRTFKNKTELIEFVDHQVSIKLVNSSDDVLNKKRKILHAQISDRAKYRVLPLFEKKGIRYEKHINDYFFIWVSA